ncbi:MAG: protein kinase [Candidatus Aminicenantes bacterium]|nr:protein kinase [Candidatus Aminicenantes bacterium]
MSTIQLIESNEKQGHVVRSLLVDHGFQVFLSPDIDAAKKKLQAVVPHLLVIGLDIKDARFFEFYHWLCNTFPWARIPRVFISGEKLVEIARELEIDENEKIFSRPLDVARFLAAVKNLLGPGSGVVQKTGEDYLASLPGRKIGSITVREEIARGGMGAVFLGYQESLERKVAVKLLLPDMVGDPYAAQRFRREAAAAARLKSPHIVQIFDFGEIDHNVFYICMEYLEGDILEVYREKQGKVPLEKAVSIISQVSAGLLAAHDAGLVHRDIKPSNLVINARDHVTITDFGLVRGQVKIELTRSDMIVGSPQYMSPEQAAGDRLDARSDIYSLGIIFYRLVAGELPFSGDNPIKIVLQHMKEPMPDLKKIVPSIPDRAVEIIERMTRKKPADRYDNCRELLSDVDALKNLPDAAEVRPVQQVEKKPGHSPTPPWRCLWSSRCSRLKKKSRHLPAPLWFCRCSKRRSRNRSRRSRY